MSELIQEVEEEELEEGLEAAALSPVWQDTKPLTKLSGSELIIYYIKGALQNISSLPFSNVVSIATISVSFFLFSGFLLFLHNFDRVIVELGSSLSVSLYLKDSASQQEVKDFMRELEFSSEIKSVKYVSKEDALALFKDKMDIGTALLDGLGDHNPLPAAIDLNMNSTNFESSTISNFVARLRSHELVDEVVYGSEWVSQVEKVLDISRFVGYVILGVALVLVMFLVSNTITLVIYARKKELGIMRLVGATDGFIKTPFVLAGVLQGFLGTTLALAALAGVFVLVKYQIENPSLFGVELPEFVFLGPGAVLAVISLGVLIGAIGSFFALSRFVRS